MYENLVNDILNAKTIVAFVHEKPDGDAIGSLTALYKALTNLNKNIEIVSKDVLKDHLLNFIPNSKNVKIEPSLDYYDMAIMLDCADDRRPGSDLFLNTFYHAKKTVVIDHHKNTKDSFYKIDYFYQDPKSAATCQSLYYVLKELDDKAKCMDDEVAFSLYSGLITDTGSFGFSSVSDLTLRVAYELKRDFNVNTSKIVEHFMFEREKNVFKLKIRVLAKAKFYLEDKIALTNITNEDFIATNTTLNDTDGIVNELKNIKGVEIAGIITECAEDSYKISLRSTDNYDVAKIASFHFSGGGHKNAAGCAIKGPYEEVLEKILKACSDEF